MQQLESIQFSLQFANWCFVFSVTAATTMDIQVERAFQKQPTVFLNSKARALGIGKKKSKQLRYVRNVGLGFKTPREVGQHCQICKLVVDMTVST